jgi:hypothetical protein
MTGAIGDEDLLRLRRTLADMPGTFFGDTGSFELIIDSGCSCGATGIEQDFFLAP